MFGQYSHLLSNPSLPRFHRPSQFVGQSASEPLAVDLSSPTFDDISSSSTPPKSALTDRMSADAELSDVEIVPDPRSEKKNKKKSGSSRNISAHQQNLDLNAANYPHPNFAHPNPNNNGQRAKKKIVCNCKKSKCLKLYCECFTALEYCDGCNCVECRNTTEHEVRFREMVKAQTRT